MAKAKRKSSKGAAEQETEAAEAREVEETEAVEAETEEATEEATEETTEEVTEEEVEEETEEAAEAVPLWTWGTGRRKTAVARVRIRAGAGLVQINKRSLDEYFPTRRLRARAVEPLKTAKFEGRVDVFANISGGGITGQAEAMLMGLARSLSKYDETTAVVLRSAGYLTRDARMVERKKYGQRGARRRFQYSKR